MGMIFDDFIISPKPIQAEPWQIGYNISNEIKENAVVLIFCSEERGRKGGDAVAKNFSKVRKAFYQLSCLDFETPICDLGDLISGRTLEDTFLILQEILSFCQKKGAIPVLIGGSNDLAYPLFKGIGKDKLNYTQINPFIHIGDKEGEVSERNFLSRIFLDDKVKIGKYHHLAYQKHLNEMNAVQLINDIDFDLLRLADMMGDTENAEPFLRRADLVTLNCDAVESFSDAFSVNFQVNGLNRREICAYMKEIGLGENLKSVGIFNFNFESDNDLNHQLLAQMLWYLVEGIDIQRTHPKERQYETFIVMAENLEYVFKRDMFSGNWYFGANEDIDKCLPCSEKDYENAKRGVLAKRFK